MKERAYQRALLGGFILFVAGPALGAVPAPAGIGAPFERGLAVDLGGTGRDALVLRASDADGFAVFAPVAGGGFELRLYPGQGPNVDAIVTADVNGDARLDLVATRTDGSISVWLGDGKGGLAPEAAPDPPAGHAGHHPPAAQRVLAGRPADEVEPRLRALLSTGASTRIEEAVSRPIAGPLPERFEARLVAFGRFGAEGEPTLALVGDGERPRLVLVDSAKAGPGTLREPPVPLVTVAVTVGSGGFFFTPNPVNIEPGDTVQWTWASSNHTVTSGSSCVADTLFCSPSNLNCAAAPTSNGGAVYSRNFPSAGTFPYFCRPHCGLGMTGTVHVAAPASPGTVPDGDEVAGVPLRLGKGAGGSIDLSWGASCTGGATNYAAYEGALPITGSYTHAFLNCNLGNTGGANVTPGAGDHYYLVVPQSASNEGSYGVDRIGGVPHPIPPAAAPCRAQIVTACP